MRFCSLGQKLCSFTIRVVKGARKREFVNVIHIDADIRITGVRSANSVSAGTYSTVFLIKEERVLCNYVV